MTGTAVLSSLHSRYTSSVTVHRQWGKVSKRDTSANRTDACYTHTQRKRKHIAYFRGANGDVSEMWGQNMYCIPSVFFIYII